MNLSYRFTLSQTCFFTVKNTLLARLTNHSLTAQSRFTLFTLIQGLDLGTIDKVDRIILCCWGCPVHYRVAAALLAFTTRV